MSLFHRKSQSTTQAPAQADASNRHATGQQQRAVPINASSAGGQYSAVFPAKNEGSADALPGVAENCAAELPGDETTFNEQESGQLVPVTQAIRYRRRAQAAEQQLGDLQSKLMQLQGELEQARLTASKLERRQNIDAMLSQADAVDVDVARLLTESAVEMMNEPDLKLVIEDLRRQKPYLFRHRNADGTFASASSMPARVRSSGVSQIQQAAARAVEAGSRTHVLDYLRLRRKTR